MLGGIQRVEVILSTVDRSLVMKRSSGRSLSLYPLSISLSRSLSSLFSLLSLSLSLARALSLSRARALPHNSAGVTNLLRGSSRWSKAVSKETYNVSKETYGKRLLETWSGTVVQMPD